MPPYVCYNCGRKLTLLRPPRRDRHCPQCGRKLHVCENCRFFDVSGCLITESQTFRATHGTLCSRFTYRTVAV